MIDANSFFDLTDDYSINSFIKLIDAKSFSVIKRELQKEHNFRLNGFSSIEKIPKGLFANCCKSNKAFYTEFLKKTIYVLANENKLVKNDTASIQCVEDGLVSIASYLLNDNYEVIPSIFDKIFELKAIEKKHFEEEQYGHNQTEDDTMHSDLSDKHSDENKVWIERKENTMNTFLGYMDYNTNRDYIKIFNYYPLYEKIGDSFVKIEQPKERFKEYGNFAIFVEDRGYPIDEQFKKGEYCVIELSDDEILDNVNYDGTFKNSHQRIYIDKLDRAGKIHKLADYDLYPIVEASSFDLNLAKSGPIELNDTFPINRFSTQVLLNYNGYYYGPFNATYRLQDGKSVLLNNIDKQRYICNRYSITNNDEEALLYCDPQSYNVESVKILLIKSINVEMEIKDFLVDDNALLEDYNNFIKDYSDIENGGKQYFSSVNEVVAKKRFERLKAILSKQDNFASYQSQLSDLMVSFIIDNSDERKIKNILEELSDDQSFMNKIQNVRVIKDRIEEEKAKLAQLETQRSSFKQERLDEIAEEIRQKNNEKERLVEEIDQFGEKFKKLVLAKDTDKLQSEYDAASQSWGRLRSQIDDKIKDVTDSASQIVFNDQFDKIVYEKMTNAISEFESENEIEKFCKAKEQIDEYKTVDLYGDELINYIVTEVKKYRPGYERNTIINMLICIAQGLLTIFSGKPGTGKTSICKILSHVLGLDNPLGTQDGIGRRFTNVHVERGWNSKRDLIGYYNPLSRKIEKSNMDIYNAFRILDLEANNCNSKLPMFILLDEANLSPMEFYWADFVGMCDDFLFEKNTINLGDNEKLLIPNTLRFLATINNDHTTETVSPRLIDRAFVVTLNNQSTSEDTDDFKNTFYPPIEYKRLIDSVSNDDEMTNEQFDIYKYFEKCFKEVHQDLSPRVKKSVAMYCSSANNLFDSTDSIDRTIIAIDYALSQKVITKIQGSCGQYSSVLQELSDYCGTKNLLLTKQHIDRIIENGAEEEYYQFFD